MPDTAPDPEPVWDWCRCPRLCVGQRRVACAVTRKCIHPPELPGLVRPEET